MPLSAINKTRGTLQNDLLNGTNLSDIIRGLDGDDILYGYDIFSKRKAKGGVDQDHDFLFGGAGNDRIFAGRGDDRVRGGTGDDRIVGGHGDDTISGGPGDDRIKAGKGDDYVNAGAGDDRVWGDRGDDHLNGGAGNDIIRAGKGDDVARGGIGDDRIKGGAGDDTLKGGAGDDRVWGDRGDDHLYGGAGNDIIRAGKGDDVARGGEGDDRINGGAGDDTLKGGAGDDTLKGGKGDDVARGGEGDDRINGGAGDDTLKGGAGDDTLKGGAGDDYINGGRGDDTAVFEGDLADYDIEVDGNVVVVRGFGFTDKVKNVEHLVFGDGEVFEPFAHTPVADAPTLSVAATIEEEQAVSGQKVLVNSINDYAQSSNISGTSAINQAPNIAALEDGGYVVVWQDYGASESEGFIQGQRYGADGTPIGEQFRISTIEDSSLGDESHALPKVAGLANGGFVVSWNVRYEDDQSNSYTVHGQRFDASGQADGAHFNVFDVGASTGRSALASVAALGDGGFVVIWQSDGNGTMPEGLLARRYGADNTVSNDVFIVNADIDGNQQYADVTALADGDFVVTWQSDSIDGSSTGIAGQRFDATGARVGDEFRVNTYTDGDQMVPSVTGLSNGDFVITWMSSGQDGPTFGIFGQRFGADGTPIGAEFQADSFTDGEQTDAEVSALADGGFVITWQSSGQLVHTIDFDEVYQTAVYGQRFDANGVKVDGEIQISPPDAENTSYKMVQPTVVGLQNGTFVVAWNTIDTGGGTAKGVYSRQFSLPGRPTFDLDIDAALTDTDGSESLSIELYGLPDGANLSAGADNGDGSWSLSPAELIGLDLFLADEIPFVLTVTATATEIENGDIATTTEIIPFFGSEELWL